MALWKPPKVETIVRLGHPGSARDHVGPGAGGGHFGPSIVGTFGAGPWRCPASGGGVFLGA